MAIVLVLTACASYPLPPPATGSGQSGNQRHHATLVTSGTGTTAAVPNVKFPNKYHLGAGDRIRIHVYNTPQLTLTARISDSGSIRYPLLGKLHLAGLTTAQAADLIANQLARQKIVVSPQVRVTVKKYRSRGVTVVGKVRQPGVYYMSEDQTIVDILAKAGWIKPKGADYVLLIRQTSEGRKQYRLSLDALTTGKLRGLQARAGDRLVVPKQQVFYVQGAVESAGVYRLRDGMTVMQAIAMAGGLAPRGSRERILIKRTLENGKVKTYSATMATELQPGDVVIVKERLF